MTTSLPSSELHANLALFRRAYAGAAERGVLAWKLVQSLRACPVWVARDEALNHMAYRGQQAAFATCATCDMVDSLESIRAEVALEVGPVWQAQERDGRAGYLLYPAFPAEQLPYILDLQLGYLVTFTPEEAEPLKTAKSFVGPTVCPSGLSDVELAALVDFYRNAALRVVNALRHLSTKLGYLERDLRDGFSRDYSGSVVQVGSEMGPLVTALRKLVTMSFEPAPATHFGTEASRVNPLPTLPACPETLRCLTDEAPEPTLPPEAQAVRVLIGPGVCGFALAQPVLETLFECSPHYFSAAMPVSDHPGPLGGGWDEAAVVRGPSLYFLHPALPALRCDAWLLAQFDVLGGQGIAGKGCGGLKAVLLPSGVGWHIVEDEDGSETVHENHRVWA